MPKADNSPPSSRTISLLDTDLTQMAMLTGNARAVRNGHSLRLQLDQTSCDTGAVVPYCNAQLDDYHADDLMRWRPPVRLRVRARFSYDVDELVGTAGFGFWNDPLGMTGRKRPRLPQCAWCFFGSPPTNLAFALDVPGHGWKAATLDAATPLTVILLPLAPFAFVALRWSWLYRRIWPTAQRLWRIAEQTLALDMRQWHEYEMTWTEQQLTWKVDGQIQFQTPRVPKGPLGLVVWIDNQTMVATPQGRFRHANLANGPQWMEIEKLEVEKL